MAGRNLLPVVTSERAAAFQPVLPALSARCGMRASAALRRAAATEMIDRPAARGPLRTAVLIDLHCHTSLRSACSALTPDALVARARARGLDAVCLTEHDATWSEADVQQLGERLGFVVLRGIEVTTDLGHVLAFGLDRFEPAYHFAENLRAAADAAGAVLALAHPARPGAPAVSPRTRSPMFDCVEGVNGSDTATQDEAARRMGVRLRLPAIGGSDCHASHEVGVAATRLHAPVTTTAQLVEELQRARHQAVRLAADVERCAAKEQRT